ncbi:hypothetical protein AB8Z38_01305 [Bradyrhizobium sp. LLZ17]|uniref:Uncharacterized protein n=1 Tax=Bradyrhizobium sp. LLZ17 TaxID=3239388 RepID=A0AB39XL82_9BRAD
MLVVQTRHAKAHAQIFDPDGDRSIGNWFDSRDRRTSHTALGFPPEEKVESIGKKVGPIRERGMSHLILTTNDLAPLQLQPTRLANVVLGFSVRFVMDRLPSEEQLMMGLEPRSAKYGNVGDH